jgi:transposase
VTLAEVTEEIEQIARFDTACQRLVTIPGIGALSATAIVAAIGTRAAFGSGRDFAAWLGLVSRQHSTGGKPTLLGISKRGSSYLRRLLIHGARSVRRLGNRSRLAVGPNARRTLSSADHDAGRELTRVRRLSLSPRSAAGIQY